MSLISRVEGRRATGGVAAHPPGQCEPASYVHSTGLPSPQRAPRQGTQHGRCRTSCQTCPGIFKCGKLWVSRLTQKKKPKKVAFPAKLILHLGARQTLDGVLCTSRGSTEPARQHGSHLLRVQRLLPCCFCLPVNGDYSGCKEKAFSGRKPGCLGKEHLQALHCAPYKRMRS